MLIFSYLRVAIHKLLGLRTYLKLAAGQGIEPQLYAPEAHVLPLDEPAIPDYSNLKIEFFQIDGYKLDCNNKSPFASYFNVALITHI